MAMIDEYRQLNRRQGRMDKIVEGEMLLFQDCNGEQRLQQDSSLSQQMHFYTKVQTTIPWKMWQLRNAWTREQGLLVKRRKQR
jgi:hypothetical protein